jgi:hypothetical protein
VSHPPITFAVSTTRPLGCSRSLSVRLSPRRPTESCEFCEGYARARDGRLRELIRIGGFRTAFGRARARATALRKCSIGGFPEQLRARSRTRDGAGKVSETVLSPLFLSLQARPRSRAGGGKVSRSTQYCFWSFWRRLPAPARASGFLGELGKHRVGRSTVPGVSGGGHSRARATLSEKSEKTPPVAWGYDTNRVAWGSVRGYESDRPRGVVLVSVASTSSSRS